MAEINKAQTGYQVSENYEILNNNIFQINQELTEHVGDTNNPHSVTAVQVGLGNVDNTSDADKPVSTAQQEALNLKQDITDDTLETDNKTVPGAINEINSSVESHIANTNNPHRVTAAQVGLGNVDNTSDIDKPVSTATQSAISSTANTLRSELEKEIELEVDSLNSSISTVSTALTAHEANTANPHSVTAEQIGLGNVDNTSDLDKPISTATQVALDTKLDKITGVTEHTQLYAKATDGTQGYMDASVEAVGSTVAVRDSRGILNVATPNAGTSGAAPASYVDTKVSGVSSSLAAHEANESNPHQVTKAQVGLGNVNNTADLDKPVSTATQAALNLKQNITDQSLSTTSKTVSGAINEVLGLANTNSNNLTTHTSNQSNPHSVTAAQVGAPTTAQFNSLSTRVGTAETGISNLNSSTVKNTGSQSISGDLTIVKQGSYTGNLVVQGDLTVQGTTITESQQSLLVEDNMIVSNSSGAELTQLSGLAIRKDSTSTYGIVYDPSDNSVSLGLGTLDSSNEFTFNEGEGLPLAVRSADTSLTDGHLLEWDSATRSLVDGGAKPTSLPNPYSLTFGSKTYNGSSAQSITAADIGALTKSQADGYYQPTGSYLTSVPVATSSTLGGVKVGSGTASGTNFNLLLDSNQVGIVSIPTATTSAPGLMSSSDKSKLNGLPSSISYPVTSVNSKTGAVTLSASDVGALTKTQADGYYQAKGSYLTSIPQASSTSLGGIKVGYTTSGKNYAISLDSSGAAYVSVPWTDTNTTYTFASGSDGSFTVTPSGGSAQKVSTGALTKSSADGYYQPKGSYLTSIPQASTGSLGGIKLGYTSSGKNYAVNVDTSGNAYVNVPWTNTTYDVATSSTLGLVKGGTTSGKVYGVSIDGNGAMTVSVPWTDTNTVTQVGANSTNYTSGNINFVGSGATSVSKSGSTVTISSTNTTYSTFNRSSNGLVPTPGGSTTTRYLREDGTWQIPPDTNTNTTYTFASGSDGSFTVTPLGGQAQKVSTGALTKSSADSLYQPKGSYLTSIPAATMSTIGGVKLGNSTTQTVGANQPSATASRTYPIQQNSSGQLVVNVPWTDTKVTQTHSTGNTNYPILLKSSGIGAIATEVLYNSNIYVNPSTGTLTASRVYGAVFNDYAEYRPCLEDILPGHIVVEDDNLDIVRLCNQRSPKKKMFVVSDTYGYCMGDSKNSVPISLSGRVLVCFNGNRDKLKVGDYLGCDKDGKARKISRLRAFFNPRAVLGRVSHIPQADDIWGTNNTEVNGRVWVNL